MHKPESVSENNILWDFEIQTDHLISARRPDLVMINKKRKNSPSCGFCCPSRPLSEKPRNRKIDEYSVMMTVIRIVVVALGTVPRVLERKLEELEIRERIEII